MQSVLRLEGFHSLQKRPSDFADAYIHRYSNFLVGVISVGLASVCPNHQGFIKPCKVVTGHAVVIVHT